MKTKQKDKAFRTSEVKHKQSEVEYRHSFRDLEVLNSLLKLSIDKSSIPELLGQALNIILSTPWLLRVNISYFY